MEEEKTADDQKDEEDEKKDSDSEEEEVGEQDVRIAPDEQTVAAMRRTLADKTVVVIADKRDVVQPIAGTFYGIDIGMRNVIAAAHSTNKYPIIIVPRKQFNRNVGVSTRNNVQEQDLKEKMRTDKPASSCN